MNITDFVKANAASVYLTANSKTQSLGNLSAANQDLQKADKRIQAQLDTATTDLSAFGKLKSSIFDVQISARALANMPATAKGNDVKTAASNFVMAFNRAFNTATAAAGFATDVATSQSSTRTGKNLTRVMEQDTSAIDSLKNVGISLGLDGRLNLDATKFGTAQKVNPSGVRDSLSKIGNQIEKVATLELASNGGVGASLTLLNQRFSLLKSQQSAIALLQQNAPASKSTFGSGFFGFGLSGLSAAELAEAISSPGRYSENSRMTKELSESVDKKRNISLF